MAGEDEVSQGAGAVPREPPAEASSPAEAAAGPGGEAASRPSQDVLRRIANLQGAMEDLVAQQFEDDGMDEGVEDDRQADDHQYEQQDQGNY